MDEISPAQELMMETLVGYVKRNGLTKEDGITLVLLADTDEMAEWLTKTINENPNVDFYDLLALIVKVKDLKPLEFEIVDDDDFEEDEE